MLNVNFKKMIAMADDVWCMYELIFADDFETTDFHIVWKVTCLNVPH